MAPAVPGDDLPTMAEPAAVELPLTSFPGLSDDPGLSDHSSVMQVCHNAWNQFVAAVGPDFINNVSGGEAARLTLDPAEVPEG
eukprot:4314709-Alexandrium_andersonii.AAC.1